MPAFFSARSVAGIGASSMITGSSPMHASGGGCGPSASRPCSFSAFSETTITPDAPSQIWLEVAAVIRPPSCSSFTPRMPSRLTS